MPDQGEVAGCSPRSDGGSMTAWIRCCPAVMQLAPFPTGQCIGHYEIIEQIGAGVVGVQGSRYEARPKRRHQVASCRVTASDPVL